MLLGALLSVLSIVRYWVNLSVYAAALIALLGVALAAYLALG